MTAVGYARKRQNEAETALSRPASPQPANSPPDAIAGAQGVEAIRARDVEMLLADARAHSMPGRTHPWCPSCVDGIEALAAALTAARAEVAENERLMIGMRNARDRAESILASVRELADEWLNEGVSENGSYPIGEVETEDMCARQLSAALTPDPSPAPVAPTAVEPTVVTSGDEASAGEVTPCRCGTDATSLNPAEVVVHQTGAPCYIAAATPTTTETEDES